MNGERDARDVPDADGRGQGGRERLEVRDVAGILRIIVPARRDCGAVAQTTDLDEPKPERQVPADPKQDQDHEGDVLVADRNPPLDDVRRKELGNPLDELHARLVSGLTTRQRGEYRLQRTRKDKGSALAVTRSGMSGERDRGAGPGRPTRRTVVPAP